MFFLTKSCKGEALAANCLLSLATELMPSELLIARVLNIALRISLSQRTSARCHSKPVPDEKSNCVNPIAILNDHSIRFKFF